MQATGRPSDSPAAERTAALSAAAAKRRPPAKRPRARPANAKAPAQPTWAISSSGARLGLFAYKFLRQTKGRYAGRPLAYEPWQIIAFSELLEVENDVWLPLGPDDAKQALLDPAAFWARVERWRREEGSESRGLRIRREGLLGVPKKNGKSTMSSGLALYLLAGDGEPGAEVYSTASTRDQARIVFRQALEMAQASQKLAGHLRFLTNRIELRSDGSFYAVVSADAGAQEGINPHGVVNDEVHAHKKRDLYDTLRSATIQRDQPVLFSITTAGFDLNTIGGELYVRGAGKRPEYTHEHEAYQDVAIVKPRNDLQRSFYFRWYQADPQKVEDIREAKRANPSSFITRDKLKEESDVPRPRGIFYRYHANIWTRVETHWLRPGAWDSLRGSRGDETCREDRRAGEHEIQLGDRIVVGVDVGQMHDTSAVVWARPPRLKRLDDPEDPVAIAAWAATIWPDPREPDPRELARAHYVVQTEEPLRLELIMSRIAALARDYRIIAVAADPYKFETQLQELEDRGILAIRFDQTNARMVPASEGLYKAVANRLIAHDGDEVLATHMDAAAARDVGGGRWRLDKRQATDVMDLAVATAIAVSLAQNPEIVNLRRPRVSML